ncbi:MAG: tetraacyldisaccharide 4'-kinase [Bacteroidia bacterium]|nr:tetraacyldisaccharide 4'-kinase [Bacteroidia bacterium]
MRQILLPLVPVYRGIVGLRNYLYDKGWINSYRAKIPVVSLGNISTGGTGKTPVAEYLIDFICTHYSEKKPAYLSRGYGRKTRGFLRVSLETGTAADFGDEALQVAGKFPSVTVAVCEDRRVGIKRLAEEYQADMIILDDAFQHRKVARDRNIVVIDATRMPDTDRLLPAGNLREPLSALKRADFLVVNKVEDIARIPELRRRLEKWGKPLFFCHPVINTLRFPREKTLTQTKPEGGKKVLLFSGIGNARSFEQLICQAGFEVVGHIAYSDHYFYSESDIRKIRETFVISEAEWLLTTEKDYWRLRGSRAYNLLDGVAFGYVEMKLEWF